MKKIVLTSALLLSFGSVQAADSLSWDSVALSYESADFDGEELSGFGLAGSKLVGENIFIEGSYRSVSDDVDIFGSEVDLELYRMSLGLGYRHAISTTTDFFGVVSYEDIEADASLQGNSASESENGYGLNVGLRSLVLENVELKGSIGYLDIADESETTFSVSGMYHFTEQFSAKVSYTDIDEVDFVSVSGVMFF
jgi:hypothetical protein